MKVSLKMIAALVIFATVSCVCLAFVYDATKPVISANDQIKIRAAQKELFPEADNFENISGQITSETAAVSFIEQYIAQKDGALIGVVITATTEGFSAPLKALVGISAAGRITGVNILENTDTPGLGLNASNPSYYVDKPAKTKTFYGQFTGMMAGDTIAVQKDNGKVVAITASTITSRAVARLVGAALSAGYGWLTTHETVQGGM